MSPSSVPHDPTAELTEVLSEVVDVVADVKQARRKVRADDALHGELDRLFADTVAWARLLADEEEALGAPLLGSMPSVAGRKPANLFPGDPSDDEVRRVLGEHLDRLADHLTKAVEMQSDDAARLVLASVARDLADHRRTLSG
jgi:hypothetical protein